MKIYYKIIIGLAVVLFGGTALWFYYGPYTEISANVIKEKEEVIVEYIRTNFAKLLKAEDFSDEDPVRQQQKFENFFSQIQAESPEIFRFKVFSSDYKIIWSNLQAIIGKDASDNNDVREGLTKGKVTLKFKSLKPEQVSERQFPEFTETYIPIANERGEYVGVIEVYQAAILLNKKINTERFNAAAWSFGIALVVYLVLAFLFRYRFEPRV